MKSPSRLAIAAALTLALSPPPADAHGCDDPGQWHSPDENALESDSAIAAVGIWRVGRKAPAPVLKVSSRLVTGLVEASDENAVIDFERYELEGVPHFALVFGVLEGKAKLVTNLAEAAVTPKLDGLHLEDLEAFREDGDWHFAALFREGAETRTFEAHVPGSDVQGKLTDQHLVDFEILNRSPTGPTFALVLADGHQNQKFFPSLDAVNFHQTVHDLNGNGYRLVDVEVWLSTFGQSRFSALFEKAVGADHLWILACGQGCGGKAFIEPTTDDLDSRVATLKTEKSALSLVDLELPFGDGAAEINAKKAVEGKPRGKAKKETNRLGMPLPPPICTHAGVLHDAGTDGPP